MFDTRYLRHRRRLRRAFGRRRCRCLRRIGGAGREGQDGGECLNTGCVPSKALIAAAKHARAIAAARAFGVAATPEVDFGKVHRHVHDVIAAIAPNDSKERFTGLGVRVIEGAAQFKDRATVVVGDDTEIKARRFVIATGSSPAAPADRRARRRALPHQRNGVRSRHLPGAPHHHRRGSHRSGAGAGVSPPRRRGDRAGSGAAARA